MVYFVPRASRNSERTIDRMREKREYLARTVLSFPIRFDCQVHFKPEVFSLQLGEVPPFLIKTSLLDACIVGTWDVAAIIGSAWAAHYW